MERYEIAAYATRHNVSEAYLVLEARDRFGGDAQEMFYQLDRGEVPEQLQKIIEHNLV